MKTTLLALLLAAAGIATVSPAYGQGGFSICAAAGMASPNDQDYYWHQSITLKTSNHHGGFHANANAQFFGAGWDISVEDDGNTRNQDYAYGYSGTTDAMGWFRHCAHGVGCCEYARPPLSSSPPSPQTHTANPLAIFWLGTIFSKIGTEPVRTCCILPDG